MITLQKNLILLIMIISLFFPLTIFSQEASFEQEVTNEVNKGDQPVNEAKPAAGEQKAAVAQPEPVIEITEVKTNESGEPLYSLELRDVELADFFRVIAHDHKRNILVDKDVRGKITASLREITIGEALDRVAEMYNLAFEEKGNVTIVKLHIITKTFILKNIKADELFAAGEEGGDAAAAGAGAAAEAGAGENAALNTIYDLLSENGKIFLGKQINSVVVMDYPGNVEKIGMFLEAIDQKTSVKVFKLQYLSVKDLFPDLITSERTERVNQRTERDEEREEISGISGGSGGD